MKFLMLSPEEWTKRVEAGTLGPSSEDTVCFITNDRWMRENGVLHPLDYAIIEDAKRGGMDTKEAEDILSAALGKPVTLVSGMAKAASMKYDTCCAIAGLVVGRRQADQIRHWRVEMRYTWRSVAAAAYPVYGGSYFPEWATVPANSLMGMALCEEAARWTKEDHEKPPWN